MDNRFFKVNGRSIEQLRATLLLALQTEYNDTDGRPRFKKVQSWEVDPVKGLVLNWHDNRGNKLPSAPDIDTLTNLVWGWLQENGKTWKHFEHGEHDADHDGSNELGFIVYCEFCGHIGDNHYSIVAIKPCYIWYGK